MSKSATVSFGPCAAETCTALTHSRRDKSQTSTRGVTKITDGTACHGLLGHVGAIVHCHDAGVKQQPSEAALGSLPM